MKYIKKYVTCPGCGTPWMPERALHAGLKMNEIKYCGYCGCERQKFVDKAKKGDKKNIKKFYVCPGCGKVLCKKSKKKYMHPECLHCGCDVKEFFGR